MDSMKADASEAYAGLGMIAGIEWDIDGVYDNFRNAIRLDDEFTVHANYGVTLSRVGRIKDAAEQYRIAYNMAPTDIRSLTNAFMASIMSGELGVAVELGVRINHLSPGKEIPELESATGALEILNKAGFDDSLAQRCAAIAFEVLVESRKRSRGMTTELDKEDQAIFCSIEVEAEHDEVLRLDEVLSERLFGSIDNYNPSLFWVGYSTAGEK